MVAPLRRSRAEYRPVLLHRLVTRLLGAVRQASPTDKRLTTLRHQYEVVAAALQASAPVPGLWADVPPGAYRHAIEALEAQGGIPGAAPLLHALVSGQNHELSRIPLYPSTSPTVAVMLAALVWQLDGPYDELNKAEDWFLAPDRWEELRSRLPIKSPIGDVRVLPIYPTVPWSETEQRLRKWLDEYVVTPVKNLLDQSPLAQAEVKPWPNWERDADWYYEHMVLGHTYPSIYRRWANVHPEEREKTYYQQNYVTGEIVKQAATQVRRILTQQYRPKRRHEQES